jgi:hypothetical protein
MSDHITDFLILDKSYVWPRNFIPDIFFYSECEKKETAQFKDSIYTRAEHMTGQENVSCAHLSSFGQNYALMRYEKDSFL